jgi:chloramphenicol O-acetyltransferase
MELVPINLSKWSRKWYFDHYLKDVPCTYSMTVKLDITSIKGQNRKLFLTMLYYLTVFVNRHTEFRTAFRQNGELGIYGHIWFPVIPCSIERQNHFQIFGRRFPMIMRYSFKTMRKTLRSTET